MTPCHLLLRVENSRLMRLLASRQPPDRNLNITPETQLFYTAESEDPALLEGLPALLEGLLGFLRPRHSLKIAPPEIVIAPGVLHDTEYTQALAEGVRRVEIELVRRSHNKHMLRDVCRRVREALEPAGTPGTSRSSSAYERALKRARNICWGTGPDGKCTSINGTWSDYTGYAAEEDYGSGWLRRIHPDDRTYASANWQEAFALRVPIVDQYRLRRANGDYLWIRCEGVPHFTEGGIFLGYTGQAFKIAEPKIERRGVQACQRDLRQVRPIRARA